MLDGKIRYKTPATGATVRGRGRPGESRIDVEQHSGLCSVCGQAFVASRADKKYCQPICARRAYTAARKADGRLAEYRKRNKDKLRDDHAKYREDLRTPMSCAACGEMVIRSGHIKNRRAVCSDWCRRYLRFRQWPRSAVPDRHPSRSTPVPLDHPSRAPKPREVKPRRWVMGWCRRCGTSFVVADNKRSPAYCSQRCLKNDDKDRRRAQTRVSSTPIYRAKIFERDGWRCQLCGKKVKRDVVVPHPLAPTLDHVIPLVLGGAHEPSNVQCAHFRCNTRKAHRGGGEQLALIG